MKNSGTLKVTTPSDREVTMTRIFDAPRHLVFEAWTKPELVKRWLYGPDDWRLAVCEMDLRVGGATRFVWRHGDGKENGHERRFSRDRATRPAGIYRNMGRRLDRRRSAEHHRSSPSTPARPRSRRRCSILRALRETAPSKPAWNMALR